MPEAATAKPMAAADTTGGTMARPMAAAAATTAKPMAAAAAAW